LIFSYLISGLLCVFAAFCYAEFASTVPVAGSAYTYARATLGQFGGWMIGWDLTLEYSVSAASVRFPFFLSYPFFGIVFFFSISFVLLLFLPPSSLSCLLC
jgi:APA family basic amino acid/polyamine antiporter